MPGFLQPIENRVLMISTGIRAQLGVKILGDDLDALQKKAFEVERVVAEVPGATGVAPCRVQGKPYLEIEVNRDAMARYGLRGAGCAGRGRGRASAGRMLPPRSKAAQRYPIQVRLERERARRH